MSSATGAPNTPGIGGSAGVRPGGASTAHTPELWAPLSLPEHKGALLGLSPVCGLGQAAATSAPCSAADARATVIHASGAGLSFWSPVPHTGLPILQGLGGGTACSQGTREALLTGQLNSLGRLPQFSQPLPLPSHLHQPPLKDDLSPLKALPGKTRW